MFYNITVKMIRHYEKKKIKTFLNKEMTILDEIIKNKKTEIEKAEKEMPLGKLMDMPFYNRKTLSVKTRLLSFDKPGIIAEFKRQSPSKGIINNSSAISDVIKEYEEAGVAAVSILTDNKYFGGNTDDIISVRNSINIPVLRKEFMITDYQVHEAKAIGADFILLIAACLDKSQAEQLAGLAHELKLDVLIEIHTEEELKNVPDNVDLVGINNRNLKTFEVDINTSKQLSLCIPDKYVKISESGISNTDPICDLWNYGFRGFLIGENFMKTENPGKSCNIFLDELYKNNF